jgi:hypothetical protein
MKQVYSFITRSWLDVQEETEEYYQAVDTDGLTIFVYKGPVILVREKENDLP